MSYQWQVLTLRHELLSARTAHAQALQTQRDAYDEAIREVSHPHTLLGFLFIRPPSQAACGCMMIC